MQPTRVVTDAQHESDDPECRELLTLAAAWLSQQYVMHGPERKREGGYSDVSDSGPRLRRELTYEDQQQIETAGGGPGAQPSVGASRHRTQGRLVSNFTAEVQRPRVAPGRRGGQGARRRRRAR